jgi:hypothetical protein
MQITSEINKHDEGRRMVRFTQTAMKKKRIFEQMMERIYVIGKFPPTMITLFGEANTETARPAQNNMSIHCERAS